MRTVIRIVVSVLGVLVLLMGAVWFLQGINVIPVGFMAGQTRWVINGAFAVLIGVGMIVVANLRRSAPPRR